jgi:hypothetical protein
MRQPGRCLVSGGRQVRPGWCHYVRRMMSELGRVLIGIGVVLIVIGVVFLALGHLPWIGRLPGDLLIERDDVRVFIPLGTLLLISLLLTLIANLLARL